MKIIVAFIALTFLFSCANHDTSKSSIEGVWELRATAGGLLPGKTLPPGNGNIIKFDNSSYERWKDGQVTDSGTFKLKKEESFVNGKILDRLILDGDASLPQYVEVKQDTLIIYLGASIAADGLEMHYQRMLANE